jgi:hypothetical protein
MDTLTAVSRVVTPGTTRLALSRGDYLIVKQRLNAGETLDLFERAAPTIDGGSFPRAPGVVRSRVGLAIVSAYLLDWSVTDPEGRIIPLRGVSVEEREAVLRALDFASLMEIMNVVTDHDAASRQEKKLPGTGGAS